MAHKRYNKYQKKFFMLKSGIVVCLILLGILGGSAIAKYYSLQKQKGVAVASDYYFSSNILKNGLVLNEDGIPSTIGQYVKTNGWSAGGGSSSVRIQIQNYQNSLLYNDPDIEIHYDMYVMLKEAEDNGIQYSIQNEEKTVEITSFVTPTKVFENQILEGGEMLTKDYLLVYNNAAATEEVPKEVYVWVVPTAPSYMASSAYMMGSAFTVVAGSSVFSFDCGFSIDIEASDAELTAEQKNLIQSQIGLVYNISTSGVYDGSTEKNLVPVTLSWNSNYVEMDWFSEFYQDVEADENGWKSIDIDLQTYSSNDIIFYRTKDFSFSAITTSNEFLGLVRAELR